MEPISIGIACALGAGFIGWSIDRLRG